MAQYIDKDALVAEIEKLKTFYNDDENIHHIAKFNILVDILSLITALEVKEVDLEKEINEWLLRDNITDTRNDDYCDVDIEETAKHFFELGLKAQKELTWEDIKMMDDISIRLDGTEETKDMSNKEFYEEVLKRFKAQKGE